MSPSPRQVCLGVKVTLPAMLLVAAGDKLDLARIAASESRPALDGPDFSLSVLLLGGVFCGVCFSLFGGEGRDDTLLSKSAAVMATLTLLWTSKRESSSVSEKEGGTCSL